MVVPALQSSPDIAPEAELFQEGYCSQELGKGWESWVEPCTFCSSAGCREGHLPWLGEKHLGGQLPPGGPLSPMRLPWGCGRPSLTGHSRDLLTSLVTLFLLHMGSGRILWGCWGLSPLGLADLLLRDTGGAVGQGVPDLDLQITGLRPSDDGRYFCTVEDADAYDDAIVELEVSGFVQSCSLGPAPIGVVLW
uniref:Ig-like domain-containing protein n=1 Tax=Anas platyrhynchos TaxID=8839 RepID=A0A8B9SK83_ANAPL